jgi:squalene-associated FAD-dependent desaturase
MAALPDDSQKSVTVVGAGVAGMSAACALAEAGLRVQLVERRGYLGGRASSYLHPGISDVIDNCQHVLFGCCTNLIGFYQRIGAYDRIHWTSEMTMIEPGGRRSLLGPSWLPAPLHGMPKLLAAHAFSMADKLSLARAFTALLRPLPADSTETLGAWLGRHGQTRGALERFWRLVIASALNADIDLIALPYAAKVIRELFMNSVCAGSMGMSTVPLSELYAPVKPFLEERGGSVLLNTSVESADWNEQSRQWTIHTRTGEIQSEYLVIALPFEGMRHLLPKLPASAGAQELASQISRHEHSPICSVHLWFDREITELEHAVLLDRELHWLYNKSRLHGDGRSHYIELVVSASHSFAALKREEAIALALRELAEFFPSVREARLEKAALVKEMRATFTVSPGIDAARPSARAPWTNCFLAGDWTATGWPSTMESAARSGHLAAEALCRSRGDSRAFLNADLEARGLMRMLK